MANLHAAVGLSQLRRLSEFIANRRAYCSLYRRLLDDVPGIVTPRGDLADASVFIFVIRVLDGKRAALAAHLKARGIDSGVHWVPGNRFSWLRAARGADRTPVTDRVGDEILTLPLWSFMPTEVIVSVTSAIREFFVRPSAVATPVRLQAKPLLDAIKTGSNEPYRVPVASFPRVWLRSVSMRNPLASDVKALTEWRNKNVLAFLTEFTATEARTRAWLTESVAHDPSRILFMIEEEGEEPLGYVGLAFIDWSNARGEADSVVRGRDGRPGVMAAALRTLLSWSRDELCLRSFGVRVLADNPANAFYSGLGFRELRREGLRCSKSPDFVSWQPVPAGEANDGRWLIHYVLPD
jgi:RimJ/RimL family protein N-acetyltransferase